MGVISKTWSPPPPPGPSLPYLLLQESPAQRHPLLQLAQLPVMLSLRLHLDFTLIGVQQLQFLLQLHLQDLALSFLCLIQSQLQKDRVSVLREGGSPLALGGYWPFACLCHSATAKRKILCQGLLGRGLGTQQATT